jgi:hypothetical protein
MLSERRHLQFNKVLIQESNLGSDFTWFLALSGYQVSIWCGKKNEKNKAKQNQKNPNKPQ